MVVLTLAALLTASPPTLATVPWSTTRVDHELAAFYDELLAKALRQHRLVVTTSREAQSLLGAERQRQLLGCSDSSECLLELSNAIGCDGLVLVSVAKLDATLTASIKVVSSRDGKVLAETIAESATEKGFAAQLELAAQRLGEVLAPLPPPSVRSRAWVPMVLGGALMLGGAASIVGAYVEAGAIDARAMPTSMASRTDATFGEVLQAGGWALVGVGAAGVVLGALLSALFPEAPVVPTVALAQGRVGLGLQVVFR